MSPRISITAQEVRKTSTTKVHELGTLGETPDGRTYRYARAGAVALDPGKIVVNPDLVANHVNRTVDAAVAVGAKELAVDIGATAMTADQYADGYLVVNDANGEGIAYAIEGNTAAGSSGTPTVFLKEPVKVALTTSSEVTFKPNNWADVLISIADQADMCVGVPNVSVAIGAHFWCQTGGECAVLADEAVAKGLALTIGSSTVGAVEALDAAGEHQIGVATEALVDTEYRSAYLQID